MRYAANVLVLLPALMLPMRIWGGEAAKPAIVSNIKVLSDKVEDVTTLEDWKKTYIKDGMSDQEKAIAIWKTVVKYRHQSDPPNERLMQGNNVHDPMKTIHVYGHGMCCCASSNIEGLARYIGMDARGRILNKHSVPEVKYDETWHLLDASLMNYFLKTDGKIASVDEIRQAVRGWFDQNPDKAGLRGNNNKLQEFAKNEGWKKGPALLAGSTFYNKDGINPAGCHGWPSNMQEYDWSDQDAGIFDYGASMGYRLNIQLREGEKLTRNWFNKDLIVPGTPSEPFHRGNRDALGFQAKLGDIAPGRTGNGTLEYNVPLASGAFRGAALTADNLACKADDQAAPALHVKEAGKPGVLILRMPCSYVYHTGTVDCIAAVGAGGSISVLFSDNNGLDWRPVATIDKAGPNKIDLKPFCYLHYDYRLKFEFKGQGTGLDALKITHDIQHSQAPLPALAEGENKISFSVGAPESTITYEGQMNPDDAKKTKVLSHLDYHPVLNGLNPVCLTTETGRGDATYTLDTPNDMTRIRMNLHWRARDLKGKDGYEVQLSFDGGKTFKKVEDYGVAQPASNKYVTLGDIPPLTKQAQVKLIVRQRNTSCVFDMRMDADYKDPYGGFRPVKITYVWEENKETKQDVHVVKEAQETYTIKCGPKPLMKTISLELAD